MLDAYEFVALLLCKVLGLGQHFARLTTQIGLAALYSRQTANLCIGGLLYEGGGDSKFAEYELDYLFACLKHTGQQMFGLDVLLPLSLNASNGFLYCLLGFDGEFVQVHNLSPFFLLFLFLPNV